VRATRGANGFLDLGPGQVLAQVAASVYPRIPARSLEDFRTLQGVRTGLTALD